MCVNFMNVLSYHLVNLKTNKGLLSKNNENVLEFYLL